MEGLSRISAVLPLMLLALITALGMAKRVDVYTAMGRGAREGLEILLRILPPLVGLMAGIAMLRASGFPEWLSLRLAPLLTAVGIPPETVGIVLVRPLSGSGALAVGTRLMGEYGPDSSVGRTAAVMLGCSETTFYTVSVYFGAAGIHKTRYTVPAALCADAVGFLAAAWAVRLLFP